MVDILFYNGPIERGADFNFIEFAAQHQNHDDLILIMTTNGGDPDAAYKMGRYIQNVYDGFKLFVPGLCKSAGTLLAIAADEIIFSPYGELGPLDIQLAKSDHLFEQDSGLNISEAFRSVEDRAKATFHELINEIVSASGGRISFPTASHCASEIIASLYGPIFASIDPEELGSRMRSMRIGEDYGVRLDQKFENLRENALKHISQTYSSHSFVIDLHEAASLFNRVRLASNEERMLISEIGPLARMPTSELVLTNYTDLFSQIVQQCVDQENDERNETIKKESHTENGKPKSRKRQNGGDPSETIFEESAPPN